MSLLNRQFFEKNKIFWRCNKSIDLDFSINMTNKSFIVKYAFIVDIDKNEYKNFDINLDKRETFDDINVEAIIAQNINFLNIANKIRSTKLNISINNVVDEIKKIWIIASLFANEINSLENEINIDINFASFFANFW